MSKLIFLRSYLDDFECVISEPAKYFEITQCKYEKHLQNVCKIDQKYVRQKVM